MAAVTGAPIGLASSEAVLSVSGYLQSDRGLESSAGDTFRLNCQLNGAAVGFAARGLAWRGIIATPHDDMNYEIGAFRAFRRGLGNLLLRGHRQLRLSRSPCAHRDWVVAYRLVARLNERRRCSPLLNSGRSPASTSRPAIRKCPPAPWQVPHGRGGQACHVPDLGPVGFRHARPGL